MRTLQDLSTRRGEGEFSLLPRIGVISNPRSHMNKQAMRPELNLPEAVVIRQAPETKRALESALNQFARENVRLIVVDGGDGTVRDVLTLAHRIFKGRLPQFAILRSGKTNALAIDLGIPADWTVGEALKAHLAGKVERRSPLQVHWINSSHADQLGFIFGSGIFLRATLLAQKVHRGGWFNESAILMTVIWAILQTMFGKAESPWRRGERMSLSWDGNDIAVGRTFALFASTLRRLPLGIRPFGKERDGAKFLAVKAPPKSFLRSLARLQRGVARERLEQDGYVIRDEDRVIVSMRKGFILDGERFPGGNLVVSRGVPVEFVVP